MIFVGVLGLGFGVILAQCFKAWVLIPAVAIIAAAYALVEVFEGYGLGHALLASLCLAFALQVGYFLGLSIRSVGVRRTTIRQGAVWRSR